MSLAQSPSLPASAENASPEAPPLVYRGRAFSERKSYRHGTDRSIAPEETMRRIEPLFRRVGLTRLADITGLDRIGIPVVVSIRPNGWYLAVDAGKGLTLEAARVSAAMECLERYAGEEARPESFRDTYENVARAHRIAPPERLPLARESLFRANRPERWTLAWDLMAGGEAAMPACMVPLGRAFTDRADKLSFLVSSSGLASGNNFLEAVLSGLYEVVERDATSIWRVASDRMRAHVPRVRMESIRHPLVLELLERFRSAGVRAVLHDCTMDTRVPVYMALLFDDEARRVGVYRGYGAHLDPEVAMTRALTEAAQSRLVYIAGSRDDVLRYNYARSRFYDGRRAHEWMLANDVEVDAHRHEDASGPTFEGDVATVLGRLRDVGLDQALAIDITPDFFPVSVARVFVPGLEGYMHEHFAPGERARRFRERLDAERAAAVDGGARSTAAGGNGTGGARILPPITPAAP